MTGTRTSELQFGDVLVPIREVRVGERSRRDLGDLAELRESIRAKGLLQSIVLTSDYRLIAGLRRLRAAEELHWEHIPARIAMSLNTALALLEAERDENSCRKDLTPEELVVQARRLRALEEPAAKERQRLHGGTAPNRTREHSGKVSTSVGGRTRDRLGQALGVSGRTLDKAEEIVQAAEQEPEKFQSLLDVMNRTGRINGVHQRLKRIRQAEAIQKEPPPLPQGPFRVIVVDPPWRYAKRPDDPTHRASVPYPSMDHESLRALDVAGLACGDAVLWLWTTNAHMPDAVDLVKVWGFEHKTILTWVKQKMGVGDWLRGQSEHCILAVRGKPTVTLTNQTTVLHADAGRHSAKPDEFYALVESLCPGSKVELFARKRRQSWVCHGDELAPAKGDESGPT
jgi:N6-adenosine-specific RNA methylase IME4/ParB-like chromosome segregation protein Spo0J